VLVQSWENSKALVLLSGCPSGRCSAFAASRMITGNIVKVVVISDSDAMRPLSRHAATKDSAQASRPASSVGLSPAPVGVSRCVNLKIAPVEVRTLCRSMPVRHLTESGQAALKSGVRNYANVSVRIAC